MGSTVNFTAEDSGFIIEADGKKLRVSYDEFKGNHEDVMKFCKEQGGGDETVENLRFIAKHRDIINEELKKLGKEPLIGWYWVNEIIWYGEDCAFVVNVNYGFVHYGRACNNNYYARAVKGL